MGRVQAVRKLSKEQFDFLMEELLNGVTETEFLFKFQEKFERPLSKSAFNRWNKAVGKDLVDVYRLVRFQAKEMVKELGHAEDADKFKVLIGAIEEKLLTATQEIIRKDPMKLLRVRQEQEYIKLRERELELKNKQHEFDREKFERTQSLQTDRFKIGTEVWKFILGYFLKNEPALADSLTAHSEQLLEGLGEHIEQIQTA